MQQPPTGYGQAPQWNGQPQQPYPPKRGQLNQRPYTPYPPQQGYALQQPYPPQQGQGQQPYGQPPPQQPKKSGKLKWVLISLGDLLVFCIGACAIIGSAFNAATKQVTSGTLITPTTSTSSNTTSTSNNSSSSSSNTTSNTNNTSAPVVGKVGQTIMVDSVACTLVSVNVIAPDQFTQPKPGNEFIVVHVKLKNNNSQQTDYNDFDFHAKSGSGNVTDEDFSTLQNYTANNQLNSGQLDPGGTVEGDIIFQVPVGDHKAELTWQPNIFGNTTQNAWNLGL